MADQQVVDYIKQAKSAGQTDGQIKSALLANGWTETEVADSFAAVNPQPQIVTQPKIEARLQPASQPQSQPEPEPQYRPQLTQSNMPKAKSSHMVLNLLIVLIILAVIGGVGYFVMAQEGLFGSFFSATPTHSSASSMSVSSATFSTASSETPAPVPAWCYTFTKNLGWANSGTDEIIQLHTALEKEGFSYAPDIGNIYNIGTSQALIQFQTKYGITPTTGFVGTKTREELNKLYGCTSDTTTNPTAIPAP